MRKLPPPIEACHSGPRLGDAPLWAFSACTPWEPCRWVRAVGASLYLAHPLGRSQEFIGKVLGAARLGGRLFRMGRGWGGRRAASRACRRVRRMLACCAALALAFGGGPWLPNVAAVMCGVSRHIAGYRSIGAYATDVYSGDHAGLIAGAGAGSWSAM